MLRGIFDQALRPLPSVVKGLQACRLPAVRPLPSVVKDVQACRLPALKRLKPLKPSAAASTRHSGHCPLLLRAFKPAVCQSSGHCPRLKHLKNSAAASTRHSGHCPLLLRAFKPGIQACRTVGGSHVHANQWSHVHANDLWEIVACTRGQVHNYTRIGDVHFLLVKYNENRNLWYMCCCYLQPCVGVGLSRLSVRPWSQLHANRKRL